MTRRFWVWRQATFILNVIRFIVSIISYRITNTYNIIYNDRVLYAVLGIVFSDFNMSSATLLEIKACILPFFILLNLIIYYEV